MADGTFNPIDGVPAQAGGATLNKEWPERDDRIFGKPIQSIVAYVYKAIGKPDYDTAAGSLNALEFHIDGSSHTIGQRDPSRTEEHEFAFQAGESVQELSYRKAPYKDIDKTVRDGERVIVTGFLIKTNFGNTFAVGSKGALVPVSGIPGGKDGASIVQVGSSSGSLVDGLSLRFGDPLRSVRIYDVVYTDDSKIKSALESGSDRVESAIDVSNGTQSPQVFRKRVSYALEEVSHWEVTKGLEVGASAGISASVSAGVPGIAEAGVTATASVHFSANFGSSNGFSTAITRDFDDELTLTVEGQKRVKADFIVTLAKAKGVPFSAKMDKVFGSGRELKGQPIEGIYEGLVLGETRIELTNLALTDPAHTIDRVRQRL